VPGWSRGPSYCVFRRRWTPIPREAGHALRAKVDTPERSDAEDGFRVLASSKCGRHVKGKMLVFPDGAEGEPWRRFGELVTERDGHRRV
jgi:hypothetical protein